MDLHDDLQRPLPVSLSCTLCSLPCGPHYAMVNDALMQKMKQLPAAVHQSEMYECTGFTVKRLVGTKPAHSSSRDEHAHHLLMEINSKRVSKQSFSPDGKSTATLS